MKILTLTLNKKPFDVMITGEKNREYRKMKEGSKIKKGNRGKLYDIKTNYTQPKIYDYVEFTNGYGKERPSFTALFIKTSIINSVNETYSNGLTVKYDEPVYCIELGDIIETKNILELKNKI